MQSSSTYRLGWLSSHPIQYVAPLLRRLSKDPRVDLTVLYLTDIGAKEYFDAGFGIRLAWDIPLLDGYRYRLLPCIGHRGKLSFWKPYVYGIEKELRGNFDAIVVNGYAHQANLRTIAIAKRSGIKVFLRGDSNPSDERFLSPFKRRVKRFVLRRLFSLVDGFLAIGTANRLYYVNYGVPETKIFLAPFAVDNEFFRGRAADAATSRDELRQVLGLEADRPVILYASKLIGIKRPLDLLDAYVRLSPDGKTEPRPYLMFVGDGVQKSILEQRVRSLGWSSIKLIGFKNQTELPRFFDLCDVFVLPSEREPWGLVINEVMNCAKPVVTTTAVGAVGDIVQDGVNGFVVPVGDTLALAQCLRRLTDDRELATAMGQRSARIIAEWGIEQAVEGIVHALKRIVA